MENKEEEIILKGIIQETLESSHPGRIYAKEDYGISTDKSVEESMSDAQRTQIDAQKDSSYSLEGIPPANPGHSPYYSRKQRKELAKMLGLHRVKETKEEKNERRRRSIQAGKQIHTQFIMETENSVRNQMAEIEARQLRSLIESFGEEKGREMFERNKAVEAKKAAKKAKKNR